MNDLLSRNKKADYIIITPVKNEEKFIKYTLDSVSNQENKPVQWIIVNDGSSDNTESIIDHHAKDFPWIKKVNLENQGFRAGVGPAAAFNKGLRYIDCDYDYIVNLDGDVSFAADYFSGLFKEFDKDSKLGVVSGKSYYLVKGRKELYRCADDSTMGPSKVYRKQCFLDIGGCLDENVWWDMLDDLRAQKNGWTTRRFKDIHFIHHKRIGWCQGNALKVYYGEGRVAYEFGYHPLFACVRSVYRMLDKPYILGSLSYMAGFIHAAITKRPRLIEPEMMVFLRKRQMRKISALLKGRKN